MVVIAVFRPLSGALTSRSLRVLTAASGDRRLLQHNRHRPTVCAAALTRVCNRGVTRHAGSVLRAGYGRQSLTRFCRRRPAEDDADWARRRLHA